MTEKAKAKRNEQAEQHARSYDPAGFYKNLPPGIANTKDDFKAGFDAGYAERDKELEQSGPSDYTRGVMDMKEREQKLVSALRDIAAGKYKYYESFPHSGDPVPSYFDFIESLLKELGL